MQQSTRTCLWMDAGRLLPAVPMVAAMFIAAASTAAGAGAPVEARGTRTGQEPPAVFTVSGWVTELADGNRIGTSILSAQLLRRNAGELDNIKVRIDGRTFNARLMSEAMYEKVADNPLLREALKVDIVCLVKNPGPLSHVELIVLQDDAGASLKARHHMPVRMELVKN